MYEAVTRGIRVRATPQYLEEESAPEDDRFFWAYTIDISNEGSETVQLCSRHWRITDARRAHRGGAGAWRGRRDARPQARHQLPLHLGLSARHAVGHHGRQLPDDDGDGRAVQRRHPRVLARQPARQAQPELKPDRRTRDEPKRKHGEGAAGAARRLRHHQRQDQYSADRLRRGVSGRARHREPSRADARTDSRPACSPPSARATPAASRCRATPTWCRWPGRAGTPIRSRWSSATASSTAAAPAT